MRGCSVTSGLSRCCFTPSITMEFEPIIVKQYKCHHCCSCKNYWGKGMEGGKKACVVFVFCWSEDRKFMKKNAFWGILKHEQQTSYCLLPDTLWLRASKNVFKVGRVKFANSLSPPSIDALWRKYAPEVKLKAAKGLKWCRAKVKGVNNPAWTAQ